MIKLKQTLQTLVKTASKRPALTGFIAAVMVILPAITYVYWPKNVDLSYAQQTCTSEITLLPELHRQNTDSGYDVSFDKSIEAFGAKLAARSTCFEPLQSPEPGDVKITTSIIGGWLMAQTYNLQVVEGPDVDVSVFARAVPASQPLKLDLESPDIINTYSLTIANKSVDCVTDSDDVSCDITELKLGQGKTYDYQFMRSFDDDQPEIIDIGSINVLRAVKVKKSSVKNGQVIYSKPKSFKFTLDKSIKSAQASLKVDKQSVDVDVEYNAKTITITPSKNLEREKNYQLTIDDVEAEDGSSLIKPYKLKFATSGGPKVTNISIGSSRVGPNDRVVVTFDQALSSKQNVAALVSVKGGQATTYKIGDRQVAVQLNNLGRCKQFTVQVGGGVISKYNIKNTQGWQYNSRTTCYTTSVYGTSLQGRSLVAYHFGNSGPVTLFTGAIHGNEVSSQYMMQSWIAELDANPDKLGNRQVVIIPTVNPDGVAAGTRNNSRDVNLSRNFPTDNWKKDIDDTDGPNKGGGGKKPLSEPAAAALARFTQNLRPRLLLSYHAVGSLVVGDGHGTYSGNKAAQYASMVGYRNATGDGGTFDYSITGAYEDWTWRNVGIPSMVIELGDYSYHNFPHHRAAMWTMLD